MKIPFLRYGTFFIRQTDENYLAKPSMRKKQKEAIAACTNEKNLDTLYVYAEPNRKIAIYGVYPTGIDYAGALASSLRMRGRNVTIHTYRRGRKFNKSDVENRRVLVVQESVAMNGTHKLFEGAAKAALKGYMNPDDFRLLVVNTFDLMRIEDVFPGFDSQYKKMHKPKSE